MLYYYEVRAANSNGASACSAAIWGVASGLITTLAGNGTAGFSGDGGAAISAELNYPAGVAIDSSGNLYTADSNNNRIRKVDTSNNITTVAGDGTLAVLNDPWGVAIDSSGNIYIADTFNNRVRKVSGGFITTVAGNSTAGFSGDGSAAISAELNCPIGAAIDTLGNVYIADSNNNRIRKVDTSNNITTVAGNGTAGFSGDGSAANSAELNFPAGVAIDSLGNIYIADSGNNCVRKVTGGIIINTVAGNGTAGFSGDGGAATSAQLSTPVGVAVDSAGNIYIADEFNYRVRKVSGGLITTVAGNGTSSIYSGDGSAATSAELSTPIGVAVDSQGNLYIGDSLNSRVRKVY